MLLELVLPGVAGAAALTPVQCEVLELGEGKGTRYTVETLEQLEHVLAGLEGEGQGLTTTPARRGRIVATRRRMPLGHRALLWRRHRCGATGCGGGCIVDGQQQAVVCGIGTIDAQEAETLEAGTETQHGSEIPERQQFEQVGVADMQPRQAIATGGRLVPIQPLQLLQQDRFLEPDCRGQFGGEEQRRVGDQQVGRHGGKRWRASADQHTQPCAEVVASRLRGVATR